MAEPSEHPGRLWALIQEWLDAFYWDPPSQRELSKRFGVSKSSLTEYKYGRTFPPAKFVARVAIEIEVPYQAVLNAVLEDQGYRGELLRQIQAQAIEEAAAAAPRLRPTKLDALDRRAIAALGHAESDTSDAGEPGKTG